MNVKKGGFLDQLYVFSDSYRSDTTDICTYVKGILEGLMLVFLCIGLGVILSMVLTEPLIVLALYLYTGVFIPMFWMDDPLLFSIGVGIYLFVFFWFMVVVGINCSSKSHMSDSKYVRVSSVWWKSFKTKTCFIIRRK